MDSNFIYCVYLTTYRGNKLPPFYIGSSSIDRITKGYHGSVLSKKYSDIWKTELRINPHLFKTQIISKHTNRKEALAKENYIQKTLNVIKSPLYINQAIAQINGYAGHDVSGVCNPMYGQGHKVKGMKNGRYGDSRTTFKDKNGNNIFTSPQDPRVVSGDLIGIGTNGNKISITKLSAKFPNCKKQTRGELYKHIYDCYISSKLKRTIFCKNHSLDYNTFLKIIKVVEEQSTAIFN
jgi:hypothetical protein